MRRIYKLKMEPKGLINKFDNLYKCFFFLTRAVGKTGLIESDTKPSIITVTSADESDVDITEAVEKATGAKHQLDPSIGGL